MNNVLTLIAEDLTDQQVAEARKFLPGAVQENWLNPAKACDLYFDGGSAGIFEFAAKVFESQGIDLMVQQTENRPRHPAHSLRHSGLRPR